MWCTTQLTPCSARHPRYTDAAATSTLKCHGVRATVPITRPHVGHSPPWPIEVGLKKRAHSSHHGIARPRSGDVAGDRMTDDVGEQRVD